ncbi:MAG: flavodoxin-dependent (E)-4-hydroxy-3-methylbut-2-enyl-diphosphate synthase [Thermoanaerobaculia bacterium]
MRRKTRKIFIGEVPVGGGSPVSVQSMTKTRTEDIKGTLKQIFSLKKAGCDIVRIAVPTEEAANSLKEIVKNSPLPIVADIHFNPKLAILSLKAGVQGLRLNPGNIENKNKIKEIVSIAKEKSVPIRIGVNGGSLPKEILKSFGGPTPEALVEAALNHIKILENLDFFDIKVSLKTSDVFSTVEAYRIISRLKDYPLHLGITEAGTFLSGTIKSSIGIGILLYEGIGDTIRVSLTDSPVKEVKVGIEILKALKLRSGEPEIISCPTCGRNTTDLQKVAKEIERFLLNNKIDLTVAVMGCEVNGPGEARLADIGIAFSKNFALIFKKGKVFLKIKKDKALEIFKEEILKYWKEKGASQI